MSAYVGVQPLSSTTVRPVMPPFSVQPMPMPQLAKRTHATPTQLEILDLAREDIRTASSVQPIHRLLAGTSSLPSIKSSAEAATDAATAFFNETPSEDIDAFAALHSSKFPLAVKAFIAGAGLLASTLFTSSNVFRSPDSEFAGVLIAFITLLSLPIIGAELTGRSLHKEFKLIPLESDNLPSLDKILDRGCTPEQFGAFVSTDLLPRVLIEHARSTASDCGTTLHDVMFWGRDNLHFEGTTWETIYKVVKQLGVGNDVSLRVKAALLMIEEEAVLDKTALSGINAELAKLASIGR